MSRGEEKVKRFNWTAPGSICQAIKHTCWDRLVFFGFLIELDLGGLLVLVCWEEFVRCGTSIDEKILDIVLDKFNFVTGIQGC